MSPRAARIALALVLFAIYATLGVIRVLTNYLRDHGLMRVTIVIAFAIAAVLFLSLIFRDPRNRTPRAIVALLITAVAYALVIYPMESPEEKIHFIEYGVVAFLAHLASPREWSSRKRFIACALFVTATGWIDEGIQGWLPSRYYDPRDVAFNAAAGLMALIAIAIFSPRERALGTDRSEEVALDADH